MHVRRWLDEIEDFKSPIRRHAPAGAPANVAAATRRVEPQPPRTAARSTDGAGAEKSCTSQTSCQLKLETVRGSLGGLLLADTRLQVNLSCNQLTSGQPELKILHQSLANWRPAGTGKSCISKPAASWD